MIKLFKMILDYGVYNALFNNDYYSSKYDYIKSIEDGRKR
jgi:hypothetical protein